MGRSYSYNELWEAFSTGTGASTHKLGIPGIDERITKAAIEDGKWAATKRFYNSAVRESPGTEDTIVRMAVGMKALYEGRSLEEAVMLGKKALYDTGDITSAEKAVQRSTMFYSFARNNLVNFIKNAAAPDGWKCIVSIARLRNTGQALAGVTPEQMKFSPESASDRVIWSVITDKSGNTMYLGSPPEATLGAINTMSRLMSGDLSNIASGMLSPEIGRAHV